VKKDPCATSTTSEERGTGELQKLVDLWRGKPRPNAQPGFAALAVVLGHRVPANDREAGAIRRFDQANGPLPAEPGAAGQLLSWRLEPGHYTLVVADADGRTARVLSR